MVFLLCGADPLSPHFSFAENTQQQLWLRPAFFLRCIPVRQIFFNGAGRLPLHEKPVDEPHRFPWYIGFPPVFFMHFFVMCFSRQVFCRSKFPVYA